MRARYWKYANDAVLVRGRDDRTRDRSDKLVLYGCGDFINDYEGISGYEQFRDDLVLMYFPTVNSETGDLVTLHITPLRICKLQLVRTSPAECEWLRERLAVVSRDFGCDVELARDSTLMLHRRVPSRA
jgi:poly-gamma-glutamate synthesis protein (capsule biosynthesis protein)